MMVTVKMTMTMKMTATLKNYMKVMTAIMMTKKLMKMMTIIMTTKMTKMETIGDDNIDYDNN